MREEFVIGEWKRGREGRRREEQFGGVSWEFGGSEVWGHDWSGDRPWKPPSSVITVIPSAAT